LDNDNRVCGAARPSACPAVAGFGTLGRLAMFTLLPTSRLGWQKVLLLPFQTYLFTAIFFYLWFAHDWPNRWKSDSFLAFAERISGGYILCFLTFTVVSVVQFFSEEQRSCAHRNFGLAIVSFALAAYCAPNFVRA